MTPKEKAQDLINHFLDENNPKQSAHKICDGCLNQFTKKFNQERIDFWLDVKNEINKL